jgi:hypothetical protein
MGHLQHFEVVKLLQGIPDIQNENTRTALLIGIPHTIGIRRDHANAETDIDLIVADLAARELETGEIALSIVIDNALRRAEGLSIATRLRDLREQLRYKKDAHFSLSSHSFHTWRFDLNELIDNCLAILLEERGLFGFAIPCDSPTFHQNFCERLKHELYRDDNKIKIQDPVVLSPTRNSTEYVIKKIKRYKQLLQSSDVICVIQVQVFTSGIADNFWQQLNSEFSSHPPNRLIIIMVGSPECVFPKNAVNFTQLSPPKFTIVDIHRWVGEAVHSLRWPSDQVAHLWRNQMLAECIDGNALDIGFTYECLSDYVRLMQQGLSFENFLIELEQRSKIYV